jgi:DNA-nicking Smr family endonuclease
MSNDNDDFKIWLNEVKGIKRLKLKQKVQPPLKPLPELKDLNSNFKRRMDRYKPSSSLRELSINDISGIDSSTLKRIDKGLYNISASIDLHGMTEEQAYQAFDKFIKNSYELHHRLVLVIVGKGKKSEGKMGLLRSLLPTWVNHPHIRSLIVTLRVAPKEHGGEGAYFILLKRARNDFNNQTRSSSHRNKA